MNYVNKENAIALKELGFDVPVHGYFLPTETEIIMGSRENCNGIYNDITSAPDFLTTADWMNDQFKANIIFHPNGTTALAGNWFSEPDHRNAAITYAINQIKNLKSNEEQD